MLLRDWVRKKKRPKRVTGWGEKVEKREAKNKEDSVRKRKRPLREVNTSWCSVCVWCVFHYCFFIAIASFYNRPCPPPTASRRRILRGGWVTCCWETENKLVNIVVTRKPTGVFLWSSNGQLCIHTSWRLFALSVKVWETTDSEEKPHSSTKRIQPHKLDLKFQLLSSTQCGGMGAHKQSVYSPQTKRVQSSVEVWGTTNKACTVLLLYCVNMQYQQCMTLCEVLIPVEEFAGAV